jgi:DNA-binding MarR family transcriptional regulator
VLDQPGGNVLLDLFVLHQHLTALMDEAFDGSGITPAQYAVYSQLGLAPRTPGQLAELLGLRAATLSGYLKAMERRGHLERERSDSDGRSSVLHLSDSGARQLERARRLMQGVVASVERGIAEVDDVVGLRLALGRLDAAMSTALREART